MLENKATVSLMLSLPLSNAGKRLKLAFDLKDLEGEDDDRLLSSIQDIVTVGAVGIVGWKVGGDHPTAGGCEVGSTP